MTNIEIKQIIHEQLRLEHLNDGEKELITELCLEFKDIFYLGDTISPMK